MNWSACCRRGTAATRFGLVWEANEIERDRAVNDDFVALDLVPQQCVGAGPWRNLIIEGDNFDALRYLRMTHAGQVKCIYIDPPYNTGRVLAEHRSYGRVAILFLEGGRRWWTVGYDQNAKKPVLAREFRLADAAGF
jgi:hypothetical protein